MLIDTIVFMVMCKFYTYKPNSLYNMKGNYSKLNSDTANLVDNDDIPLETHDKANWWQI